MKRLNLKNILINLGTNLYFIIFIQGKLNDFKIYQEKKRLFYSQYLYLLSSLFFISFYPFIENKNEKVSIFV